eukprot:1944882-Prorocentrum_lima.AAC.1
MVSIRSTPRATRSVFLVLALRMRASPVCACRGSRGIVSRAGQLDERSRLGEAVAGRRCRDA